MCVRRLCICFGSHAVPGGQRCDIFVFFFCNAFADIGFRTRQNVRIADTTVSFYRGDIDCVRLPKTQLSASAVLWITKKKKRIHAAKTSSRHVLSDTKEINVVLLYSCWSMTKQPLLKYVFNRTNSYVLFEFAFIHDDSW